MKRRLSPQPRRRLLALAISCCFAGGAWALPTDPVVVNGTASFAQTGNVLTVTNSNGAIIHWQSFNIGAGETTHFLQPSASSSVLNHVLANNPSALYGTLSSNGRVWLVNPAGIVVGPGAVIDTAGFVASTLTVRAEDFLAGKLTFQATPGASSVVNQGEIRTPSGGFAYLVGANVTNEGLIRTPNGETLLAAGQTVSLIDTATPGVKVEISGAANNATNLGQIVAEAGRIGIAGSLVKNSGTLDASSVVSEGGRIFLKASQDAYVDGAGRIVATGTKGGRVEALGNRVAVMDQAEIDASGANGGGTILVGGDYLGGNPEVPNAWISYFGPNAALKANATDSGDGGKVIVWADDTTRAYGRIEAKGGPNGGNGGFVETSGKRYLDVNGIRVNTGSGTWLLDPSDVYIVGAGGTQWSQLSVSGGVFSSYPMYGATYIGWDTIINQLAGNNVVITTTSGYSNPTYGGSITVVSGPGSGYYGSDITISHAAPWGSWSNSYPGAGYTSPNSLTLLAHNAVNINAWFGNAGAGAITIMAGWDGANHFSPQLSNTHVAGRSINIAGSYGAGAGIASLGPVHLHAVDGINISPMAYGAGIDLGGSAPLTLRANKLSMTGGNENHAQAFILSNGPQSFTLGIHNASGGLFMKGSDAPGKYGARAKIESFGGQSFAIQNGASVELRAGSGDGFAPANEWSGWCSVGNVCSGNGAVIGQYGPNGQTFSFYGGGSLNLYGGGAGSDNSASIENEGIGQQRIEGNPSILLQGGSGGGTVVAYGGKMRLLGNGAFIESEDGQQTISASAITMHGGTANYGGAIIGAPTQYINVAGALTMTGGSVPGGLPAGFDAYGGMVLRNLAAIGSDEPNTTVNLSVGSLTMAGGPANMYGGSPAAIGGYMATSNVNIHSSGAVELLGTGWSNLIGSLHGTDGTVFLSSAGGPVSLGAGLIHTGASGTVGLSSGGSITQAVAGGVVTGSLSVSAASGINLPGASNKVARFGASNASTGPILFNNSGPLSLGLTTGAGGYGAAVSNLATTNGSVSITANGSLTWEGLGSYSAVTSSQGSISLTAIGATSDIVFAPSANSMAVHSSGGSVSLNAGRDVLIGVGPSGSYADIYSVDAPISIAAGRDLLLDNFTWVSTGNANLDLSAGRNVAIRSSISSFPSWAGAGGGGNLTVSAPNGYIYIPAAGASAPSGAPATPGVAAANDVGGGRISSGGATTLVAKSGIVASSPSNGMTSLSALNSSTGDVIIANTSSSCGALYPECQSYASPLTIGNTANNGAGVLSIANWGPTVVSGNVSGGGAVSIIANSPLTISSGASVSGAGGVTLAAMSSGAASTADLLAIFGNVTSSGGNISLSGASGVTVAPGVTVSAPSGTIQVASAHGSVTVTGATLNAISVMTQGSASTAGASATQPVADQIVAAVASSTEPAAAQSDSQLAALSPVTASGIGTTPSGDPNMTAGGGEDAFGSTSAQLTAAPTDREGGAAEETKEDEKKETEKKVAADKKEDQPAGRKLAACN